MKLLPPSTCLIGLMLVGVMAPNIQAASGPTPPNAPDVLPNKGLAQHDLLLANPRLVPQLNAGLRGAGEEWQ